jgi:ZIP family zinc transporter
VKKLEQKIFWGIMIPFIGTSLGAALVFFTGKNAGAKLRRGIHGFSAGVMVAASVWSLLIPSIKMAEERGMTGTLSVIPAVTGLFLGIIFFLVCDRAIEKYSETAQLTKGKSPLPPEFISYLAIAIHNLPEGMAVGAVFAEILRGSDITSTAMSAGFALSVGIAVQNLPEGAIVSVPLCASGKGKLQSFFIGMLSGVIEPLGAALTLFASSISVPLLPYLLGFAAGAMLYAVLDGFAENSPYVDGRRDKWASAITALTFSLGFVLMMSLDVILG